MNPTRLRVGVHDRSGKLQFASCTRRRTSAGWQPAFAGRAGWPWVLPPRAPTDPDVHTLAHPVPRPTVSPSARSPRLSNRVTVTCCSNLNVLDMFPSIESAGRRFAFLHRVLRGEFPCFNGTIKALRLPAAHPTALRCLRLAVPRFHSLCSLPGRRVHRRGLELVTRYLRPGSHRGNDRTSQVPGEPQLSVCTCSNPTPAGLLAPDHYGAAAWPLVNQQQRLPRKVFRSSIAWLSDSLCTLRSARHHAPRNTRFRSLVRRYRTGFPPARFR